MEVTSMDPATAKLAIELQLTDINEILAGLHPGPVQDDTIAAFEEMKANYQEILQVLEGQVLALNILKTEQQNRVQFNKLMEEEAQAVRDHEFACQLAGIACSTPRSSATRPTFGCSPVDTPQPAARPTFTCPPLDDFSDHEDPTMSSIFSSDPAESTRTVDFEPGARTQLNTVMRPKVTPSSSAPSKPVKDKAKEKAVEAPPRMCSACMEQYPRAEILELTCKREDEFFTHAYCHTCLIDLFESSMTDTTLFPPRCCGRKIPVYAGAHFFEPELITRYEEKEEELGVENPTYCSNRSCAVFIRPANIKADIATCKTCESKTCSICKNPLHLGLCPEDPGTKMLMDVAEERKWQRCYKCRTMVELLVGCYHMRCTCGGEFCYLCAKPWKTCTCPKWHEERLFLNPVPANNLTRAPIAQPEAAEIPELNPAAAVAVNMHLRLAHVAGGFVAGVLDDDSDDEDVDMGGCVHEWRRVYSKRGGREMCSICRQHLKFVNLCTRCNTQVCNRCLNNRL